MQGYSVSWWKDRHNLHHAHTNVLDSDPDIDNLPLFIWTEKDLPRIKSWMGIEEKESQNVMKITNDKNENIEKQTLFYKIISKTLPYQAYYFLPFCTLLRCIWCLQSWRFVSEMKNKVNSTYIRKANLEKSTLIIHWIWYIGIVCFLVPHYLTYKIYYFLISQFVGGFCIAIIVFF